MKLLKMSKRFYSCQACCRSGAYPTEQEYSQAIKCYSCLTASKPVQVKGSVKHIFSCSHCFRPQICLLRTCIPSFTLTPHFNTTGILKVACLLWLPHAPQKNRPPEHIHPPHVMALVLLVDLNSLVL